MVNILYSVCATTCAIVAFIIADRTYSTFDESNLIDRAFVLLSGWITIFCLIDSSWGLLASGAIMAPKLLFVLSFLFHAGAAITAYIWLNYILAYASDEVRYPLYLRIVALAIVAAQLVLLIINIRTHNLFYVDDAGVYCTTSLRFVLFYLQYIIYIAIAVLFLVKLIRGHGKRRRAESAAVLAYVIAPIFSGVFQMFFPDAPFYSIGYMLGCCVIYSFIINKLIRDRVRAHVLEENADRMRKENERLQQSLVVINALSVDFDYVCYVDPTENEIYRYYASPSIRKIFDKFDPSERSNLRFDRFLKELVLPEDWESFLDKTNRNLSLGKIIELGHYEADFRGRLDGIVHDYRIKFAPDSVSSNNVIIGIYSVDKEVAYQKELQEAMVKAEAANEAKSRFLFNMSHDIRTPMNAVLGFTRMARKYNTDTERLNDCLDKIEMSGEHLLQLINDVLDMARIEKGYLEITESAIDVCEAVDSLVSIVRPSASAKNLELTNTLSDITDRYIYADTLHLDQILLNVISNSIKYTPANGRIDILVRQVKSDNDLVKLEFTIKDSGVGMDKEMLNTIYDPFVRSDTATRTGIQGTGLGMSIVKQLVDRMNGHISVDSKPGEGTTVVIDLSFRAAEESEYIAARIDRLSSLNTVVGIKAPDPNVAPSDTDESDSSERTASDAPTDETPADSSDTIEPPSLVGLRILLVEDNPMNREIAADLLGDEGLLIDEATDGEEAVAAVSSHDPDYYKFVLMDIQMPKMNGYEATTAIRALTSNDYSKLPIIAMTANAFDEDREQAAEAGMTAHLSKPISAKILFKTLREFV